MTDPQTSPIVVAPTPGPAQQAALIRQIAGIVGTIALSFGAAGIARQANIVVTLAPQIAELLVLIGPVVTVAAVWLGQLATRRHAKQLAALEPYAPNEVAVKKQ